MSTKYLSNIDLQKNQLLNAAIQNLSSAPSSPIAGQVYFDTTVHALEVYDGTSWFPTNANKLSSLTINGSITGTSISAYNTGTALVVQSGYLTSTVGTNQGAIQLGSSTGSAIIDYGITTASILTIQNATNVSGALTASGNIVSSGGNVYATAGSVQAKASSVASPSGTSSGDLVAARTSSTGVLWLGGSSGIQIDYNITSAGNVSFGYGTGLSLLGSITTTSQFNGSGAGLTSIPTSGISGLQTFINATALSAFAVPTANVSMNSHNITNLLDPVNAQDAATKNYVDTNIQAASAGITAKPAVALVSTSNIATLSGTTATIDGVAVTAGMRVLLAGQTTTSQNGPYVVASGAWSRASGDPDGNNELALGAMWYVEQGTTYAGTQFILNSPTSGAITPGTTSVTIVQFNGAANITAGNGLTKSGATISALANGTTILVASGGLSVNTTAVGGSIPLKSVQAVGNGSATAITLTGLTGTTATNPGLVSVYDTSGNEVYCDVTWGSAQVTLTFATAPASNAYNAVILY